MKRLLVFCCLILSSSTLLSRASKGKEFWIAFMENVDLSNFAPPTFQVHVSSETATTCTISIPKAFFTATFAVNAQQVFVYTLPNGIWYPQGDEDLAGTGIHLQALDSVEVKAYHHRQFFSESTVVLPLHELGTSYMAVTASDTYSGQLTEFVVLALQNNSVIEINPSAKTLSNKPAYFPFTATLQAGEVYQIQSASDLSGSIITSLNPANKIAVFGGAQFARSGCNVNEMGHMYEQLIPVSSFGETYHVVPFLQRQIDEVKVVASQSQTSITATSGQTFVLTRGQAATFTISAACEIRANKPITVAQFASSKGCNFSVSDTSGGAGMILLQPVEQTLKQSVFYTLPSIYYGTLLEYKPVHYLNLVTKTSAIGNAKLDTTIIASSNFSVIPGNSGYSCARLKLDTLSLLQHTLSCDSGFNATIYCFTEANFNGHHLGFKGPNPPMYTAGIAAHEPEEGKLFPNPITKTLQIFGMSYITSYVIKDCNGRIVATEQVENLQSLNIDLSALSPGYYNLLLNYGDRGQKVHKLIKLNAQ